jgi:hypothetical protein
MRKIYESQLSFGSVDIKNIKTDTSSRDEIDKVVLGLQELLSDKKRTETIFELLNKKISPKISKNTGRPGMPLWNILVLAVFRQACNWDYDKLHHMANNHFMLQKLFGHDIFFYEKNHYYSLQTIKDNVMLLTPELLIKISDITVNTGHDLARIKRKNCIQVQIHLW